MVTPTIHIPYPNHTTRPVITDALADWATNLQRSVLRQMIAVVSRPGILSFAGGLPAPELFPRRQYAAALAHVLAEDPLALQYKPPFEPLKAHLVQMMARRGVACRPEQIFITTGAQQALSVLAQLFMNPGDEVILEENVYTGVQQVVAPYRPHILPVSTDLNTGMVVEEVANYLAAGHRPGFIYAIPDAHNPLGVSLSAAKRERLVSLAATYGVPILEDDPYGFLIYDADPLPPLRALDSEWVFYAGSFSKIIAPALRLGWMVAPEQLVHRLTVIKEAGDLESSALTQRAVAHLISAGELWPHIAELHSAYRQRRAAMLNALAESFPAEAQWTEPAGGMFIWVELPERVDTEALLSVALEEEQIAFIPGRAFAVPGSRANHCLRLSFSTVTPERITDGIQRLGRVVAKIIKLTV